MKVFWVGLLAVCGSIFVPAGVTASSRVLISQLQTGDALSASNEAVEVYNNSDTDIDISNWCLRYTTSTSISLQSTPKYCFTPPDTQTQIFLSAKSYGLVTTAGYVLPVGSSSDGILTGSGFAAGGGHIKLVDVEGVTLDLLGWGTAVFAEGYVAGINPAPVAPSSSQSLGRKQISQVLLQDTDNNRSDFELRVPAMKAGGIYELRTPVDLCGNIGGIQETLPSEYGYDEAGNCELLSADLCSNIVQVQVAVPGSLVRSDDGGCYTDTCPNIDGLQRDVPAGFILQDSLCELLENRELLLSEIFPNASGSDTGQEFIEIYNPNSEPIELEGYTLWIGKNLESSYALGLGESSIPAGGFIVVRDSELGFTLLNTESSLRLLAPAGNIVSEATYREPKDDQSWAMIDGAWQYTNQLTPLSENTPMLVDLSEVESASTVSPSCPSGKYRHPITNRCRNIESDTSMLVACDSDEYRNPETNRCRKIATLTATLASCNEGYERNPETNRCRKIASAVSLAPCQAGYERNLATNRCRKVITPVSPTSTATAVQPTTSTFLRNTLLFTTGIGAVGYGLYEWRSELVRGIRRVGKFVSGK